VAKQTNLQQLNFSQSLNVNTPWGGLDIIADYSVHLDGNNVVQVDTVQFTLGSQVWMGDTNDAAKNIFCDFGGWTGMVPACGGDDPTVPKQVSEKANDAHILIASESEYTM
jgi:hypothetical protein